MFRKAGMIAAALLLTAPGAAHAEWREAQSRHFTVYSEGSDESLRQTVIKLEKYDFLLRFASGMLKGPEGLKPKVYLVSDMKDVADALPFGGSGVGGFYDATQRGAYFVSPRSGASGGYRLNPQEVLFHEYAHHFMFNDFPATYPTWYSEGFAEFYGTPRILPNEVIEAGHAAVRRYASFRGTQ